MRIKVADSLFDPLDEIRSAETELAERRSKIGASSFFVGSMRDFNEGDSVQSMFLEHYSGMTEKRLEEIAWLAKTKWSLDWVLIVHRIGQILPAEPIVLVATWSAHRAQAFDSCRAIMEKLKSTAPFWKKESLNGGTRWVKNNTVGYSEND
ncbi:MAG: molybdenum cofactor biosynthesis protein MoaE [Gammaproteobacteria bacterium]